MLRYFTIDEIQNASEAVDKPNIGHSTERNRALVVVSKERKGEFPRTADRILPTGKHRIKTPAMRW